MLARSCLLPLFGTLVLFFSACASDRRVADEASVAEARKNQPPTMTAETAFFDGKLIVEVNLGRGFRPRMVKPNWKPRAGDNGFGTTIYEDKAAREIADEEEENIFIPRMRNSTLPPVALRLRVNNLTAEPVEVVFLECKSYLGNFAVRPEKITIPAGESGQPDPMVSLLGVSGEEIPVTITLSLNGNRETHTAVLVPVKSPASSASPEAP
jgi:hypothetical protein